MIHDEVVTGFGRTGTMFGSEHWGAAPDIIAMGKGISSGYAPLGAVGATDEVFNAFLGDVDANLEVAQISTFGGHPVSCAAALASLRIIQEDGLLENAVQMSDRFLAGLQDLKARHAVVGDARGKGLLCGLELVDPDTGEPMALSRIDELGKEGHARGVLLHRISAIAPGRESIFILGPPLVISAEEIDRILEVLDEVLGLAAA